MTFPTALSPWYLVVDLRDGKHPKYLTSEGEWSVQKKDARLFMSLLSAVQMSEIFAGDVLTVASEAKAREYGVD